MKNCIDIVGENDYYFSQVGQILLKLGDVDAISARLLGLVKRFIGTLECTGQNVICQHIV